MLTFYNALLSGARVPALHHRDFAVLPKKVHHGIVGNSKVLRNLSVLWKVLFIHLASTLQAFLRTHRPVSRAQFAMWPRTSVEDVLRVVHDWFLLCWLRGQHAWMVLDDIINAFDSLTHATN